LTDGWDMLNSWSFTVDKDASVFIASVFGSPFVTDWILDTVVFTQFFSAIIVTDTTRVSFTLVFGVFGWGTGQVVTAWAADWWLFNTFFTEVAHDDLTFTSTFGSHTFDIVMEDHFSGFHQSTSVIASGGRFAFFKAWKFEAFGRVTSATFASSSSDLVGLAWWAYWWMVDAKRFVALALVFLATAFVSVEAFFFALNEFSAFTANWHGEQSAFSFEVWNDFSTSFGWWAFVDTAASIIRNFFDKSFTVSASWFFDTLVSDVSAGDFSGFSAATWLTSIVFVVKQIADVVFNTFVFASVTTGAIVTDTTTFIDGFGQFTTQTGADWSNSDWTRIADTLVFHAAVQSFGFVSDRV
jgi:hypothetical protein